MGGEGCHLSTSGKEQRVDSYKTGWKSGDGIIRNGCFEMVDQIREDCHARSA